MRLLVVEDDPPVVRMLRQLLEDEGYTVDVAIDGCQGERQALATMYDVIVLDLMLPCRDGVAVCERLRQAHVWTPLLMLTARDAVEERVRGLDAGADDYLVKPFASDELVARLRTIIRRRAADVAVATLQTAGLVMDLQQRKVFRDGNRIDLSPREFALLQCFLRHPGQVLSRSQLLGMVWSNDGSFASNVVEIYVHYLRDKIDRSFPHKLLHTVRGAGYMLKG